MREILSQREQAGKSTEEFSAAVSEYGNFYLHIVFINRQERNAVKA